MHLAKFLFLANFIPKTSYYAIINTLVHIIALIPALTEPPKIIPYYRLSMSMWSLSNNKQLLCRLYRGMPGKSLTIGSRYALSPHEGGTRVHHYIT
jgi:hypothetical protein